MDHKIVDFIPDALYLRPMKHDLDARGLLCPLPVLKARKRLKDLTPGMYCACMRMIQQRGLMCPIFANESGNILRGGC